jgi:hypothetical protein
MSSYSFPASKKMKISESRVRQCVWIVKQLMRNEPQIPLLTVYCHLSNLGYSVVEQAAAVNRLCRDRLIKVER